MGALGRGEEDIISGLPGYPQKQIPAKSFANGHGKWRMILHPRIHGGAPLVWFDF